MSTDSRLNQSDEAFGIRGRCHGRAKINAGEPHLQLAKNLCGVAKIYNFGDNFYNFGDSAFN